MPIPRAGITQSFNCFSGLRLVFARIKARVMTLGEPMLKRLDLPAAVPFGLFSKAYALISGAGRPHTGQTHRGPRSSVRPRTVTESHGPN